MKWEKYINGMYTGGIYAEVRSIRFRDETGVQRRYRICSAEALSEKFTRRPARARLVKSKEGKIGVVIQPAGSGMVKVGKRLSFQPYIFASIGAISKKPAKRLLRQASCVISESEGGLEAYEE